MIKTPLLLLPLFLTSAYLQAGAGYGIDVSLQSPLVQETASGTIITATFLVTNRAQKEENFTIRLDLPPEWISIPFEEPFFTLKASETRVQMIAIRVPPSALAGSYPIDYTIQGREHPSLIGKASFSVLVLPKSEIKAFIEKAPKYTVAGGSYLIDLQVINTGNVENDVDIQIKSYQDCEISTDTGLSLHLKPGQIEHTKITVKTKESIEEALKNFVHISLQIKEDPDSTCYLSSEVEIFPKQMPKVNRYHELPMKTVFGYGMKNQKKQLFVEQYGGGPLDAAKKKMWIYS